jgi:CheY-like chemotaxis protein
MRNKRHKILVVDDEHVIASTLATILGYQGYETATAYSGEEAIQVACSFQPNFILSDIMMGAMNGVEAAIEILRTLPECRVLFISGNAGYRDLLKEARTASFDFEVLEKPIPPPQLLAKISQILLCRPAQTEQLAV